MNFSHSQKTYTHYENHQLIESSSSDHKYSPIIVDDLLQGHSEWRNIQDIIKLTFRALTDVVKAQGESIRELEKQLPTRASKQELQLGLQLKANVSDVSRTIQEVSNSLEQRLSYDDGQNLLKDYVLRNDLQYLLSNKVGTEELRHMLDNKITVNEVQSQIRDIFDKFEEVQKEVQRKLQNTASQKELQLILAQLERKADKNEVIEQLDQKASKQSVTNALHRKANKADFDSILARKAEITDLQGVINLLESKIDMEALDKITHIIDQKADRSEINLLVNALYTKAEQSDLEILSANMQGKKLDQEQRLFEENKRLENIRNEIEDLRYSINAALNQRVESKEFERISEKLDNKIDYQEMKKQIADLKQDVYEDLIVMKNELNFQKKTQEDQVLTKQSKFDVLNEQLNSQINEVNHLVKNIQEDRKNDIEETAKFVKNVTANCRKECFGEMKKVADEIDLLRKVTDEIQLKKLEKKEYVEMRSKLIAQMDEKVDLVEVQTALNACQSDISGRFVEFKDEIKSTLRSVENNLFVAVNKKADSIDVNTALSTKADQSVLQSVINQKIGLAEFEDIRRLIEKLIRELDDKVGVRDFDIHLNATKGALEELHKDLLLKSSIKDVCTLLDNKANIEDVNKALTEIHKELDTKSNQEEINNIVSDQAIINESLCTENIVGRWTWKSGELRSGNTIPWEVQVVNTLPNNFLWEKDKSSILTVAPGLYEVTFGFFSKKKPTVQLLVNGEPIISAVNTASYVIHHTSGKLKDIKHSGGIITGLTMIDFIVLPARARLSFTFTGEFGGEGFFGLRRL